MALCPSRIGSPELKPRHRDHESAEEVLTARQTREFFFLKNKKKTSELQDIPKKTQNYHKGKITRKNDEIRRGK